MYTTLPRGWVCARACIVCAFRDVGVSSLWHSLWVEAWVSVCEGFGRVCLWVEALVSVYEGCSGAGELGYALPN